MYALVIVMAMAILPPPHYPSYTHPRHHHHRGVAAPGARLYYTHLINIHTRRQKLPTTLAILFSSLWPISRPEKLRSCAKYSLIRGYKFLQVLYFCRRSATALAAHSPECFYYLLLCLQPSVPRRPGRGWHTNGRLIWHKISPLVHHWTRLSALTHI